MRCAANLSGLHVFGERRVRRAKEMRWRFLPEVGHLRLVWAPAPGYEWATVMSCRCGVVRERAVEVLA
jgi:hypothetical protein